MKKNIAKKLLILNAVILLVFAVISFLTVNVSNLKINSENMLQKGRLYSTVISEYKTQDEFLLFMRNIKNELHITVIATDGSVIFDNQVDDKSIYQNFSDNECFNYALGQKTQAPALNFSFTNSNTQYDTHAISEESMLYVYYSVDMNLQDAPSQVVVRYGIIREFDTYYWGIVFPILCIFLVVITVVSMILSNRIIGAVTQPLQEIQTSLSAINKGDYSVKEIKSKYPEINSVVLNIREMSAKISASMRYLHYEQRKTNSILQSFETGFIALNQAKKIVLMNTSAQKIFNSFNNAIGQYMTSITADEILLMTVEDAVASKEVLHCELEVDNAHFRVAVSAMDTTGLPEAIGIAVLIMFTDISAQKKEQEIRNEFFANASHELRSPLTAIKGFAEIALSSADPLTEKCATEISKNAARMLKLINDMLKISRHNAKIIDEKPESFKLKLVAEEVGERLESLFADKNIKYSVQGDDGVICGRRMQIEEMLSNLVDNAIKYNRIDGEIKVIIKNARNGVNFKVSDTGIGIPFEHQKRIFDSYYRVDKGRDRKIMSTGLGLTIVRNVIESHNGSVTLDSKPDIGTTFIVNLKNIANEVKKDKNEKE